MRPKPFQDKKATTGKELCAHNLRCRPTIAERWMSKSLARLGFRRSVALFGYIVNFYNPILKIVVKINRSSHKGRKEYDKTRDGHLAQRGIKTLRFTNNDVFDRKDSIIARVRATMKDLTIPRQRNAAEPGARGRRAVTQEGKAATEATNPRAS